MLTEFARMLGQGRRRGSATAAEEGAGHVEVVVKFPSRR